MCGEKDHIPASMVDVPSRCVAQVVDAGPLRSALDSRCEHTFPSVSASCRLRPRMRCVGCLALHPAC